MEKKSAAEVAKMRACESSNCRSGVMHSLSRAFVLVKTGRCRYKANSCSCQ